MEFGVLGEYESFSDIKDKEINPFIETLKINERFSFKRFKRGEAVLSNKISRNESIELTKQNNKLNQVDLGIGKIESRQSSPFILLYLDQAISYKDMNAITLKVFMYIIYEKTYIGCDYVVMNIKDIIDHLEISKASAYNSMFELVKYKVIERRNENVWWINPAYFYCGNRLSINTK